MHVDLTDEQRQLRDTVRGFARERVKPAAQNFDWLKGEAIRQLEAGLRDVIRRHVWRARCLLVAQPRFTRHEHIWQHDTLALRRDLDHEFRAIYGNVAE